MHQMWSRNAPKKLPVCPSVYYLPQMWKSWTYQSSVYKGKSHFTLNQMSSMSRYPEIQVPRCPVCFICPEVQLQMYNFKCPVCPVPVLFPAAVYTICWTPRGDVWESSILLPSIHPQIPASQHFGLQDQLRVPFYCV